MSFMAVATIGSAVVGGIASNAASKRAAGAADRATDAALQSAEMQYDLGQDTLDFNKEYFNTTVRPAAEFDLQSRQAMFPRLMDAFDKQEAFADQQREDYLSNWQPLEQRVRRDSLNYDSQDNIDRRSGIAAANVNQQFSNSAGQQARLLARYGVNPNSSAFANTNAKLATQQALTSAGMQTGAAFETMDKGIALRAGAANFGRNMPNAAATFGQLGNATAQTGAGITGGAVSNTVNAGNFMNSGFQNAGNILRGASGSFIDAARNSANMGLMQAQGVGQIFQGVGQGLGMWGQNGAGKYGLNLGTAWQYGTKPGSQQTGMLAAQEAGFADGGPVGASGVSAAGRNFGLISGPGDGVSDSIPGVNESTGQPMRLSNNEYIIPEDVVRAEGTEFFDKLLAQYHTPAEAQRLGMARRA